MSSKKVRYMVEGSAPFSIHAEGLSIQAITRKSEVPVTVEIEGMTRRMLVAFQEAIQKELMRREKAWDIQREQLLGTHEAESSECKGAEPSRPAA